MPAPTVGLWRWRLDPADAALDAYWAILPDDERQRADRFYFPQHRRRFIAAHGRLRTILGACVSADPAALRFATNPQGKPSLVGVGEGLHFNLSHSEEMALLGVTDVGPLGVDIEWVRPVGAGVAEHHFAAGELRELQALPEELRLAAFFLCWTRKEAYIKAIGRGLAIRLDSFQVSLTPGAPARLVLAEGDDPAAWHFAHLCPAPGYAGAIALRHVSLTYKWNDPDP